MNQNELIREIKDMVKSFKEDNERFNRSYWKDKSLEMRGMSAVIDCYLPLLNLCSQLEESEQWRTDEPPKDGTVFRVPDYVEEQYARWDDMRKSFVTDEDSAQIDVFQWMESN